MRRVPQVYDHVITHAGRAWIAELRGWVECYGGWSNVTVVPDGALASVGTMSATPVYLITTIRSATSPPAPSSSRYGGSPAVRLDPDLGLFLIPTGPPITS